MSKVAAILLAAGRSRRMGAFKPLLPFGERTVVEACARNLLAGGVEEIVVVTGHRALDVRRILARLPVRFALNADPESEMGVSIARGVEQLTGEVEAVFIALVDQPAVPPEVMRILIDERARWGARILIPEYRGRGGHPVLLDMRLREELLTLSPQRGLRGLLDEHRDEVERVVVDSPYVARDMDRWDDYRALYRELYGTEPPVEQPPSSDAR